MLDSVGSSSSDVFAALAAAPDNKSARKITMLLAKSTDAGMALAALKAAKPPLRGRLTALAAEMALNSPKEKEGDLRDALRSLAKDGDLKTASTALQALGALSDHAALPMALRLLDDGASRVEMKYAALRTLMNLESDPSDPVNTTVDRLLTAAAKSPDIKMRTLASEASERRRRDENRDDGARVRLDVRPSEAVTVVLRCRAGLTGMLAKMLPDSKPATTNTVTIQWRAPLSGLCTAKLWDRIGIAVPVRQGKDFVDTIVRSLGGVSAVARGLTSGKPSFRLDATKLVSPPPRLPWRLSEALRSEPHTMPNDPRQSVWELQIAGDANRPATLRLTLWAKAIDDPRFDYRQADVPAASHPTIAAALAQVAGVHDGDVIWDPFVGSGLELIERARLGKYKCMHGTDIDPVALAAMRANAAAAGITGIETLAVDARRYADQIDAGEVPRPTLILTNPPFGRRVGTEDAAEVVMEIARRSFSLLAPGGRLVWISPEPGATADALKKAGMEPTLRQRLDMGGFSAEMQAYAKPARRPAHK